MVAINARTRKYASLLHASVTLSTIVRLAQMKLAAVSYRFHLLISFHRVVSTVDSTVTVGYQFSDITISVYCREWVTLHSPITLRFIIFFLP